MMTRILTYHELRDHGVLLSRRQIDRLETDGKLPKLVPISEARIGWLEKEIDEYVRKRISGRATGIGSLGSRHEKRAPE